MRVDLVFITPEAEGLIALGHESVLEHATATFEISGISRAGANPLTRHWLASFVQESQRYVDGRQSYLVRPPTYSEDDWQAAPQLFHQARELYAKLLEQGVPKEDARYVLPLGIETRLVVSANFRELRHILQLRLSPRPSGRSRSCAGGCESSCTSTRPAALRSCGRWRKRRRVRHDRHPRRPRPLLPPL